jgi:hypothetical protein
MCMGVLKDLEQTHREHVVNSEAPGLTEHDQDKAEAEVVSIGRETGENMQQARSGLLTVSFNLNRHKLNCMAHGN